MHEMAYAEGILAVALDVAEGHAVRCVQVRVGTWHALVPDSLQFCFELAAQDTPAARARLDVRVVPGEAFAVDAVERDDGWRHRPGATDDGVADDRTPAMGP
jgi:Zn finger protein HypA/HybF involved in hydrogenase expression